MLASGSAGRKRKGRDMIREPENMDKLQLTVVTIDGGVYAKRDTTSCPFGKQEHVVVFWDDAGLVTLPMSQVKSVTLHFE